MTLRRTSRRDADALDDLSIEALLAGRPVLGQEGVAEIVQALRTSVPLQAPTASDALAVMLADGVPTSELAVAPSTNWIRSSRGTRATSWSRSTTWTRRVVQVAGVSTGLLALTVGAAAADQLPDAVQERVASVVQQVTSVELPRPTRPLPTPPRISPVAPGVRPLEVPAGPRATPDHPVPGDRGKSEQAPGQQGRDADGKKTDDSKTDGKKTDGKKSADQTSHEQRGEEHTTAPTAPRQERPSDQPALDGEKQRSSEDSRSRPSSAPAPDDDVLGKVRGQGAS